MLPSLLAHYLDVSRFLYSPLPASESSSTYTQPLHLCTSSNHILCRNTTRLIERNVTNICDDTLYYAQIQRDAAAEGFQEVVEEHEVELESQKAQSQEDISRMIDDRFEEFEVSLEEHVEAAEERIERLMEEKLKDWSDAMNKNQKRQRHAQVVGDRKRHK